MQGGRWAELGGIPNPLTMVLHLPRRRDRRADALLEQGVDVGEQLDLLDGGVRLAHALVPQPRLLAAAAYRNRRQELLHVVRGRERRIAPDV